MYILTKDIGFNFRTIARRGQVVQNVFFGKNNMVRFDCGNQKDIAVWGHNTIKLVK